MLLFVFEISYFDIIQFYVFTKISQMLTKLIQQDQLLLNIIRNSIQYQFTIININKTMSRQPNFSTNSKPKMFPCAICKKLTDQTCSLCRKIFYCSSEHQQVDWHMRHKIQCEGKILANQPPSNWTTNQQGFSNTQNYSTQTLQLDRKATQIRLENESKQFMDLFEQRLILRKKAIDKYLKLIDSPIPITQQPQYTNLLLEVNQVSSGLITIFKPNFIPVLQQMYGITTSEFILKLDEILDKALMAKYHLLIHKHEQVRRFLFSVHQELPTYPNLDVRFRQVYENVLKTVLKVSQVHCNDKVTEGLLAKFILMVQKFDGISQQVYTYFNLGNWYLQKTYHHKAIRCFNTSLDLMNTHQKTRSQQNDSSAMTRADLLFNLSLSQYYIKDQKSAFDNMQESYRLRVKAIGKNSIEASNCLQTLARWASFSKYWEDCLQYAKECYRVRKLNNINYPRELEIIERLLQGIYGELKKEKQKNEGQMNMKPAKYFETLINPCKSSQAKTPVPEPQESFIKQLTSNMKQELIQPKVVVTPDMAETYSSIQWEKLTKLLYDTDKMMEKEEFRRVIFESEFTESLSQEQRDIFIKANKID